MFSGWITMLSPLAACPPWSPGIPWDPLGAPSRQEAAKHGRGAERQGAQPLGSLGVA